MSRTAAAARLKAPEPEILAGTFFFDPADRIYEVHFPGNPVVPGSMIVSAFLRAAKESGLAVKGCSLHNFRFRRFVAPGAYAFRIEADGTALACSLYANGSVVATGILKP